MLLGLTLGAMSWAEGGGTAPAPNCRALGGVAPGTTLHEAVAAIGAPERMYLSGADGEGYKPQPTDDLVIVFEREIATPGDIRQFELFATVPPNGNRIRSWTLSLGNPFDSDFRRPTAEEVREWLGPPSFTYRRRWVDEGPESRLGECSDPGGTVETWAYPDCLQVWFEVRGEELIPARCQTPTAFGE